LKEADKTLSTTLMQALSDRRSDREFADKQISLEELSSLLWAANGINRENGKRTAPSAVNAQDIDIYICMANGAYLYDAKKNQLRCITTEDIRSAVAGNQQVMAPLFLVMIADLSRYPERISSDRARCELMANVDAGYVSGNIGLYCAAANLVTVPRATMDKATLKKALKLTDSQLPILNNPVGYAKK
jgi:nitroreductase